MADHDWADHDWADHDWNREATPADETEVRHVQPYQAVKVYRCPGCDHEIPKGQGHEVVVPLADPAARRHWHTSCWHREAKRTKR